MGYHDATGRYRATKQEFKTVEIRSFHLAAGTPLAAFADGASDTPGLALDNSEATGVRWNNHAAPLAIVGNVDLPRDRKPGTDVILHFKASKSGATVGDAVTFLTGAFANVVGALHDADANFGGTSSAMDGDAAAKTMQDVTLTLAAADIPDPSTTDPCPTITLSIKPTDGTLGTDDVTLRDLQLEYTAQELAE